MKKELKERLSGYKKIHVIGISGQEGRAVFDYLTQEQGIPEIIGHESSLKEDFQAAFLRFSDAYTKDEAEGMLDRFLSSGAKINFGADYLKDIEKGDLVIVTQAWRRYKQNAPLLSLEGVEIIQAIEIVMMLLDCRTVGVTGTAGKSTTTAFIASILHQAKKKFYFSGNDRENKWDLFEAEKMEPTDVALLEISHRHLMDLKASPDIAVLTNIYPHHLDDAGSFENYVRIKTNIFRFQDNQGKAIVNVNLIKDKLIDNTEIKGSLIAFSANALRGMDVEKIPFKGEHNLMNAAAGYLVGKALEIDDETIEAGIINTKPLKYRMEEVASKDGLTFWNDGKSSDPLATIEAVKSVPELVLLFLGGVREGGKPGEFLELGKEIASRDIPKVYIGGKTKELVYNDLIEAGVKKDSIELKDGFKDAFASASTYLKGKTGSVLFSPSCQSFDEFKDYRERAEAFNDFANSY